MDFELIATATRWTAKASLLLYCFAFLLDAKRGASLPRKQAYLTFTATHFVHLGFVSLYFIALGEAPAVDPVLGLLVLGVLALLWLVYTCIARAVSERALVFEAPLAWFLWILFGATHITRLMDPSRGSWLNAVFLAIVLATCVVRLWLGRKGHQA